MLPRILTVVVVAFWLASVGWLCAVVWAPPESRMARVDPREVYEVFFSWNESTRMTLLESGSRRGEVTVAGSSGEHRKTGAFSNAISLSGTVDTLDPANDFPGIDLSWRGLAEFNRGIEFQYGDFSLRIPGLSLTAHLSVAGDPPATKASVSIGDLPVFQYDSAKTSLNAESLMALAFASFPGGGLPLETRWKEGAMAATPDQFEVAARMGNFSFGGRNLRAYLLIVKHKDREGSVRIFLSEAGEPLRLETDFGLEVVSEILVPLDAYLKKNDNTSDD